MATETTREMKKEFNLKVDLTIFGQSYDARGIRDRKEGIGKLYIRENNVHITVCNSRNTLADIYFKPNQLETIAVNILKSLKSKRLKK